MPGSKPSNKASSTSTAAPLKRSNVFGDDSDSDETDTIQKISVGPGESQKRQARLLQEKALEEDPTVYQYDELYDEMANKRVEDRKAKTSEVKKAKYITKLLETADKRKKEHERRIERQVQKEREEEGEMFKDKESFVTSAYRQKLEEMKKAEEDEKREAYLESIGDVTKQNDLDGFYRHIYEQQMGPDKPKVEVLKIPAVEVPETSSNKLKEKKERTYRKRKSSCEEKEEEEAVEKLEEIQQKSHLQSNLDADSDFSIDSSDSEDETEKDKNPTSENKNSSEIVAIENVVIKQELSENEKTDETFKSTVIPNVEIKTDEKIEKKTEDEKEVKDSPPKKKKVDIWKKRTVGDAFDEALKRYYERKASRGA